jgi:hypothetical protein
MPFAFVIVYPDWTLEWLSRKTGKTYQVKDLILLEAAAVSGMMLVSLCLMSVSRRFTW